MSVARHDSRRKHAMQIAEGTRVTLHFTLCLENGEEIDSTRSAGPATFVVGDGTLPDGFEQALFGLCAGDEPRLRIEPEQGFGLHNEDNLRFMPADRFAEEIELEAGVVVSFSGADGDRPGVIRSVEGELVVVDFNHPLAGKPLIFEVSILKVEALTEELP